MKIITWNIYKKNKNIRKAIAFLKKQKVDIICLQEFPATQIHILKDLGMHVALCDELQVYKSKRKKDSRLYSVIISRFPILAQTVIPHKYDYNSDAKIRSRYKYFQADSLYIDIDSDEGLFRIFNTHFKCVAGPNHRLSQFKEVASYLSADRKNIVCGDFNMFGKPLLNILLWKLFGYKAREIRINESKTLAKLLEVYGLKNPLKKQVTFWKFPVQLDYILVPKETEVKSQHIFLHPHGSDHFPLLLEV